MRIVYLRAFQVTIGFLCGFAYIYYTGHRERPTNGTKRSGTITQIRITMVSDVCLSFWWSLSPKWGENWIKMHILFQQKIAEVFICNFCFEYVWMGQVQLFCRQRHLHPIKCTHSCDVVQFCFWLSCRPLRDSHDVFTHILQGCFTGSGAIIWLPQCQWSNPEDMGKIDPKQDTT